MTSFGLCDILQVPCITCIFSPGSTNKFPGFLDISLTIERDLLFKMAEFFLMEDPVRYSWHLFRVFLLLCTVC